MMQDAKVFIALQLTGQTALWLSSIGAKLGTYSASTFAADPPDPAVNSAACMLTSSLYDVLNAWPVMTHGSLLHMLPSSL